MRSIVYLWGLSLFYILIGQLHAAELRRRDVFGFTNRTINASQQITLMKDGIHLYDEKIADAANELFNSSSGLFYPRNASLMFQGEWSHAPILVPTYYTDGIRAPKRFVSTFLASKPDRFELDLVDRQTNRTDVNTSLIHGLFSFSTSFSHNIPVIPVRGVHFQERGELILIGYATDNISTSLEDLLRLARQPSDIPRITAVITAYRELYPDPTPDMPIDEPFGSSNVDISDIDAIINGTQMDTKSSDEALADDPNLPSDDEMMNQTPMTDEEWATFLNTDFNQYSALRFYKGHYILLVKLDPWSTNSSTTIRRVEDDLDDPQSFPTERIVQIHARALILSQDNEFAMTTDLRGERIEHYIARVVFHSFVFGLVGIISMAIYSNQMQYSHQESVTHSFISLGMLVMLAGANAFFAIFCLNSVVKLAQVSRFMNTLGILTFLLFTMLQKNYLSLASKHRYSAPRIAFRHAFAIHRGNHSYSEPLRAALGLDHSLMAREIRLPNEKAESGYICAFFVLCFFVYVMQTWSITMTKVALFVQCSFWWPQISTICFLSLFDVHTKFPLSSSFMIGMSGLVLVMPFYLFGYPYNVFNIPTDYGFMLTLFCYVALQLFVLFLQKWTKTPFLFFRLEPIFGISCSIITDFPDDAACPICIRNYVRDADNLSRIARGRIPIATPCFHHCCRSCIEFIGRMQGGTVCPFCKATFVSLTPATVIATRVHWDDVYGTEKGTKEDDDDDQQEEKKD